MERWKPIKGLYSVSDKGRVWSYKSNKFLSQAKNKYGYLFVQLNKNGKKDIKKVHRLVAETFIDNPDNYPEVHHQNEIKTDNRIENLEWVSSQFNCEFSKSKVYVLYDPSDEPIEIFNIQKFARQNNLSQSNLTSVAHGKQTSYKGFTTKPGTKLNKTGSFQLMSPEGKVFTFNSQQRAAHFIGSYKQPISALLSGKLKSCKGWTLP